MDTKSVTVSVKHTVPCPAEPRRFAGKRRLGSTLLQDTTDQFEALVASQSRTDTLSMENRCK